MPTPPKPSESLQQHSTNILPRFIDMDYDLSPQQSSNNTTTIRDEKDTYDPTSLALTSSATTSQSYNNHEIDADLAKRSIPHQNHSLTHATYHKLHPPYHQMMRHHAPLPTGQHQRTIETNPTFPKPHARFFQPPPSQPTWLSPLKPPARSYSESFSIKKLSQYSSLTAHLSGPGLFANTSYASTVEASKRRAQSMQEYPSSSSTHASKKSKHPT